MNLTEQEMQEVTNTLEVDGKCLRRWVTDFEMMCKGAVTLRDFQDIEAATRAMKSIIERLHAAADFAIKQDKDNWWREKMANDPPDYETDVPF